MLLGCFLGAKQVVRMNPNDTMCNLWSTPGHVCMQKISSLWYLELGKNFDDLWWGPHQNLKLWTPLKSSQGAQFQNEPKFCVLLDQEICFQVPVEDFKSLHFVPKHQSITIITCWTRRFVSITRFAGWVDTQAVCPLQEWADFDEKKNQSVGVYELEHQFVKV